MCSKNEKGLHLMLFSEGTLDDDILFCSELYLTNIFPQKIVIQCLEFFFSIKNKTIYLIQINEMNILLLH